MPAPLIVTRDKSLHHELLRLAAAAGVVPDVAGDVALALRSRTAAPVVLVAAMPDQRGVGEAVDLGAGPVRSQRGGALARAARAVLVGAA